MTGDRVGTALTPLGPGPTNGITDVPGIEVGQATRAEVPYLTGTTVVLARNGAVAAVDVRGSAPATRETDALDPRNLVEEVHAVVLSGGSAYGLDAASGVARWLEEHGIGFRVGPSANDVVPVVPAAALFDLGRGGSFAARPDAAFGYAAAEAAAAGPVEQGNVGAGTGTLFGGFTGRRLKGGLGTASVVTAGGVTVGAVVAVNASGSAINPETGLPYAIGLAFPGELPSLRATSAAQLAGAGPETAASRRADRETTPPHESGPGPVTQTVLAVVATDAALTTPEAGHLARSAHDGIARAIRPAHTRFDGDAAFALATSTRPIVDGGVPGDLWPSTSSLAPSGGARSVALAHLGAIGADCLSRAIVHAVLAAVSVGEHVAYRDAFPDVFREAPARTGETDSRASRMT